MHQLGWILLLMLVGWVGGLALWHRHYCRERARKWAEIDATWDRLIAASEREPFIEEEFSVTQ